MNSGDPEIIACAPAGDSRPSQAGVGGAIDNQHFRSNRVNLA